MHPPCILMLVIMMAILLHGLARLAPAVRAGSLWVSLCHRLYRLIGGRVCVCVLLGLLGWQGGAVSDGLRLRSLMGLGPSVLRRGQWVRAVELAQAEIKLTDSTIAASALQPPLPGPLKQHPLQILKNPTTPERKAGGGNRPSGAAGSVSQPCCMALLCACTGETASWHAAVRAGFHRLFGRCIAVGP